MDKRTELTVRGRTRTVEEWARWRGMTVETLVWRLEHGWEASDAVLVPVRPAAASVVVTAFGRTLTPGEWERENGVPATLIGKRIKLGWTPEDAVSRPVRPKRTARTVTVGGETLAVHEWSERTGIPTAVISSRLSIGWTPERAVSEPIRKRRGTGRQGVVIGGERLTVREWSERTGIPANIISNRLNRGWTPERVPARRCGRAGTHDEGNGEKGARHEDHRKSRLHHHLPRVVRGDHHRPIAGLDHHVLSGVPRRRHTGRDHVGMAPSDARIARRRPPGAVVVFSLSPNPLKPPPWRTMDRGGTIGMMVPPLSLIPALRPAG